MERYICETSGCIIDANPESSFTKCEFCWEEEQKQKKIAENIAAFNRQCDIEELELKIQNLRDAIAFYECAGCYGHLPCYHDAVFEFEEAKKALAVLTTATASVDAAANEHDPDFDE